MPSLPLSRILTTKTVDAPSHHTHTIIFIHGFGETAEKWIPLATEMLHLKTEMQHFKFIFPTAVEQDVTLWREVRRINAWFDLPSWNDITYGKNDEQGMLEAIACVDDVVEQEAGRGVPLGNIYVGGFSQGGSLGLLVGLLGRHRHLLGGIFALAAYLPMIERVSQMICDRDIIQTLKVLKIFMGHGNGDPQVKWNWGQRSYKALQDLGFSNVVFQTYSGVFHSLCLKEIDDLADWLHTSSSKSTE